MVGEGLKMERLIGPNTAHKYEPETKKQLTARIDELVTKGRAPMPPKVRFTTYTLRYNKMDWIEIDALEKHWERADVDAELGGDVHVTTKNVAAFSIGFAFKDTQLGKFVPKRVVIDGNAVLTEPALSDSGAHFRKSNGQWVLGLTKENGILSKHHGLQGPIDDAFLDSFIFVRPTGKPLNDRIGAWAKGELERAIVEWRRVFRGEARVKDDTAITADDIASANLILWGDPSGNKVLAKILPKLPLAWDAQKLTVGKLETSAADHAPILIFPNPLNPQRYVVLNSGFTFREGSNTTNSQQTPKLPDWAVIDLKTPPNAKWPGLVVDAGFFDERWQLPKP